MKILLITIAATVMHIYAVSMPWFKSKWACTCHDGLDCRICIYCMMKNFFQIFKKCQLSEDLKQYFEQSRDVASFHYNSVVWNIFWQVIFKIFVNTVIQKLLVIQYVDIIMYDIIDIVMYNIQQVGILYLTIKY